MLLGGDELGRTQQGNNNAYCQDNAITWFDWSAPTTELLEFTRRLIALRRTHPVFRRRRFLTGADAADLAWFTPAGTTMTDADWADPGARARRHLPRRRPTTPTVAADGTPLVDDDFLVLVNAWWEPLEFALPPPPAQTGWRIVLDTHTPTRSGPAGATAMAGPRSLLVLQALQGSQQPR